MDKININWKTKSLKKQKENMQAYKDHLTEKLYYSYGGQVDQIIETMLDADGLRVVSYLVMVVETGELRNHCTPINENKVFDWEGGNHATTN